MAFLVKIGNYDITGYIASDGYKWERNDIDSHNSGRDSNGMMHRRVIAQKDKLQITCRALTAYELGVLINALDTTTATVEYTVPGKGQRTSEFYNSKRSAGVVQDTGNSVQYSGVSFDLIEV